MNFRETFADKKRIVVKIGSSSLTHKETGALNMSKLEVLVRELTDLHNMGKEVVLVSSGAIAVGRQALGFSERPAKTEEKQACAPVGQASLRLIYLQLFFSFLQIGTLSVGGGYAALPLIQNQVVALHHWISMAEFTDLITISQMTPGPIAINSATFVGIKIAGMPGALVATLGCILPSCIIVTIIAYLYMRYRDLDTLQGILGMLRPAVVALIASAGISILITAFFGDSGIKLSSCNPKAVVIFAGCLILLRKRVNPVLVMVLAGIVNVGLSLFI